MTHWQDKGTCPQALPGTSRGSPSRPSRWRAHTHHLGAKDDDCSFRLFYEKGRRPVVVVAATEAVPPGPACKGTNPENQKAPFSPQAASPAPPRALACKQKGTQSHTHRGSPLLCLLSHPSSFVLPTSFFQFFVVTEVRCFRALPRWCQHQIVTTAQNADLVVTQTRIPSALPRWCQHLSSRCRVVECNRASTTNHYACRQTNQHSIGHFYGGRTRHSPQLARNDETHSRKWKQASHRHFSTPMWQKPAWHRHLLPILPPLQWAAQDPKSNG
jgi:hypothetical protein